MVEVIVAIVILAVGVLGLAGTTALVIRQITLADLTSERAAAVQTVIERLRSMAFDSVGSGSATQGSYAMAWTSVDDGNQSKVVTIVTAGPGLGTATGSPIPLILASVRDTFQYRVLRP